MGGPRPLVRSDDGRRTRHRLDESTVEIRLLRRYGSLHLPPRLRSVVEMRLAGLSTQETADGLRLSVARVSVLWKKALTQGIARIRHSRAALGLPCDVSEER